MCKLYAPLTDIEIMYNSLHCLYVVAVTIKILICAWQSPAHACMQLQCNQIYVNNHRFHIYVVAQTGDSLMCRPHRELVNPIYRTQCHEDAYLMQTAITYDTAIYSMYMV